MARAVVMLMLVGSLFALFHGTFAAEIVTNHGDVTIVVSGGRQVGYQIGDRIVLFDQMPAQWSNYTDAGNKGILAALQFGFQLGQLSNCNSTEPSVTSELFSYMKVHIIAAKPY